MFTGKGFFTVLISAVMVVSVAYGGEVLFQDDFKKYKEGSDGSPTWLVEGGECAVTSEGYQVKNSGTDGSALLGTSAGKADWADYTLSCKVKLASPGGDWRDGVWIAVRYMDEMNMYIVSFYSRGIFIHKMSEGVSTGDENPLKTAEGEDKNLRDGEWHDVKITVEKNTLKVSIDGKEALSATDEDHGEVPAILKGKIALGARKWTNSEKDTVAIYKDVRVEKIK